MPASRPRSSRIDDNDRFRARGDGWAHRPHVAGLRPMTTVSARPVSATRLVGKRSLRSRIPSRTRPAPVHERVNPAFRIVGEASKRGISVRSRNRFSVKRRVYVEHSVRSHGLHLAILLQAKGVMQCLGKRMCRSKH